MVKSREEPLIIVQSRMGSLRLPGKALYPFNGKAALAHLLESLLQSYGPQRIVVASSQANDGGKIEALCHLYGVRFFAGDEHNVASRFFSIVSGERPKFFVRISGDSPLLDYRIVQHAENLLSTDVDLVSTAVADRYPSGMHVEALNSATFLATYPAFTAAEHFEHVTRFFYENQTRFRIAALRCPIALAERFKFSLDTAEDAIRLQRLFEAFERPHFEYPLVEKCRIYEQIFGAA